MSRNGNRTGIRKRRPSARIQAVRDAIVEAVEADAPVSVRGVYYRVVSAGVVDKDDKGYHTVQGQLLQMRIEGIISWDDIADGTRELSRPMSWTGLGELFRHYAHAYRREIWPDQGCEVIFVSEKDAVSGVVASVTARWDVPLGIFRGFSSASFLHVLGQHITYSPARDIYIYHLGDHDPSGLAIDEVVKRDLARHTEDATAKWHYKRLAITLPQARMNNLLLLPVNPNQVKRHMPDYIDRFGPQIVELDALPANTLRALVEAAIRKHIDPDILSSTLTGLKADKARLRELSETA